MAALLDMSNGRANIAYVGETPWHGMGQKLEPGADLETWRVAAGLEWSALKTPIFYQVGVNADQSPNYVQAPDQFMVIRDDTFAPLGSFTGRYKVVQPDEVLAFFRDFILADDRFELETAGALKGGAVIWALARFRDRMSILGEEHAPYVMLTTSFDGTRATTAQATMIRVVCNNTLTASIYDKQSASVRVRHSTVWSDAVAAKAHDDLVKVSSSFDRYADMAKAMHGIKMAREVSQEFLKKLILKGKDEADLKARGQGVIDALLASYDATLKEGTEKNTGWTTLNAVTRFVDHGRSTRRTNGETVEQARMASSVFGSGAQLKADALAALYELA